MHLRCLHFNDNSMPLGNTRRKTTSDFRNCTKMLLGASSGRSAVTAGLALKMIATTMTTMTSTVFANEYTKNEKLKAITWKP